MATNLALNDEVIEEVKKLGGHKAKREANNAALAEYIARRQRRKILDLFRTLDGEEPATRRRSDASPAKR